MYAIQLISFALVFISCTALAPAKPIDKIVVLITGSSAGIGKSAALEFAKSSNYKVWATMRNPEKWNEPERDNLKVFPLDVQSDESVKRAIEAIIQEDKKIDVVINNAGYGLAGCLEVVKLEEAQKLFDVNVWGVVRVLQEVLPHMRRQKSGYIINMSSTSGIRGIPCMEYYTGSKFALEGITDSMRYSLAPYNITITNVNAGPVRTSFTDRFGHQENDGRGSRPLDDNYLQGLTDDLVRRLGGFIRSPQSQASEDVARLFVSLVSLKLKAKGVSEVPFNIGSSYDSQKVLEGVRKFPTGWGGIYYDLIKSMPPLPEDSETRDEL